MSASNSPTKKRVLFVGAFTAPRSGLVGGQLAACMQLLASPLSQYVEWRKIDASMLSLPPPNGFVRLALALWRLGLGFWKLLIDRPDIVFVFASFAPPRLIDKGGICILARLTSWLHRRRVVLSFRSEIHPPRFFALLSRWWVQAIVWSCDAVMCQSDKAADRLASIYGADRAKLHVIPNWIDLTTYAPIAQRRRSKTQFENPPTILYLGWLETAKGIFSIAEAAAALRRSGRKFRVVCCGSGGQHEALAIRCRELQVEDTVELRGWVDLSGKLSALGEADLFTLPSHHEGMPNALMEALASGLPAVATPVGAIPSLITDGVNGYIVPIEDSAKLAEAWAKLLDDPAAALHMGRTNADMIRERYDISVAWRKVADMLGVEVPPHDRDRSA